MHRPDGLRCASATGHAGVKSQNKLMEENLKDEDLANCALILDRGLFFYKRLQNEKIQTAASDRYEVSELAFYTRALAEITAGLELWFKSAENISALSSASFLDFNHYLIKGAKLSQRQGKELGPFAENILESAKDKYYALYYPDGKVQTDAHRKKDELFVDAMIITSKFIHQDEYSIIGLNRFEQYDSSTIDRLVKIAAFWCMDFRNQSISG